MSTNTGPKWDTIAALLVAKLGREGLVITQEDCNNLSGMYGGEPPVLLVTEHPDGVHLDFVRASIVNEMNNRVVH